MKILATDPIAAEMAQWRQHLHKFPETAFEENATSKYLVERLTEFGLEVHQGLACTGVVASLHNGSGPAIGLRADMDALHLHEKTDVDYKSVHEGKMHACGHDGHMAMLLGAAKYLSETRNFKGTVRFIFQPAEENEGGGRVMVEEGLFEKFPVNSVFGMHNWPELPAGEMGVKAGPIMASCDLFEVTVRGQGCHGAMPHLGIDPVVIASQIVLALQTIASRIANPQDAVVVSVTQIQGGETWNVIPQEVIIRGTARSFNNHVQKLIQDNLTRICQSVAAAHNGEAEVDYRRGYPATINDTVQTELAAQAAERVVGKDKLRRDIQASMGAEDFSYMLQEKPGCYIWLGTGGMPGGCLLHNPGYDFNDNVAHIGASYWVALVEQLLAG